LFIPELANGSRALAWRVVARGILTQEEVGKFEKLLRFQPPGRALNELLIAVELRQFKAK
jgi:hypothetical protein